MDTPEESAAFAADSSDTVHDGLESLSTLGGIRILYIGADLSPVLSVKALHRTPGAYLRLPMN